MTTGKLYQEAISEANDLLRMAEERARDKLIESVMPRIRDLLEKKILEGEDVDDDVEDLLLSTDDDSDEEVETDEFEEIEGDAPPVMPSTPAIPVASTDSSSTLDIKIPSGVDKVTLSVAESNKKDTTIQLDESNIQDLIKLIDGRGTLTERARSIQIELRMLRRELDALSGRGKKLRAGGRIVEEFNAILRKSIGLKQEIRDAVPGPLAESAKQELNKIEKEIKEMSTKTLLRSLLSEGRRGKINEEVEEMDTMEADEEEASDDAAVDVEDSGDESGDLDVDAVKDALKSLASAVGMELVDEGGEEESGEDMDMGDDLGGEEEPEEKEESVTYEFDEMSMSESDEEEEDVEMSESESEDDLDEGEIYEIDETVLRAELKRLRALREAANGASAMAHHFGGGKAGKDAFESPAKLNANESGKGKGRGRKKQEEVDEADSAKDDARKEKVEESRRNRELMSRLNEAAKAIKALDRQLDEQKLFNAKLLYVNKLMQSSSLTDKQFRSIVEALDSAKNLREAHLLYTSLSESLAKPGRSLSEGVRSAGGSSRPTGAKTSGTTLNEGAVVDRWAILAGIK
jgi:hypothetical protein